MVEFSLTIPEMGEGIMEVTFNSWVQDEGKNVEPEQVVASISTDKIDNEIISPVKGKIIKKLVNDNDIVPIGATIAILLVEQKDIADEYKHFIINNEKNPNNEQNQPVYNQSNVEGNSIKQDKSNDDFFISPLVKTMINENNISKDELDLIKTKLSNNIVTKKNIEEFIKERKSEVEPLDTGDVSKKMDPIRKKIADNMLNSLKISAHVTSFVEADFTDLMDWRDKQKDDFFLKNNTRLSLTAIMVQIVAKAIKDFPMINISVVGDSIVYKKDINIGIATLLPNNNLIVPVIKKADKLSLAQIASKIEEFNQNAKNNKLTKDDIQGGTYTITNIGVFGNIAGTPIINQPQVAILAVGQILKKPSVIQTQKGDVICVRKKSILSHSYDHRVIDGYVGCSFLKKIELYINKFGNEI